MTSIRLMMVTSGAALAAALGGGALAVVLAGAAGDVPWAALFGAAAAGSAAASVFSYVMAQSYRRRAAELIAIAQRYRLGDFTRPRLDYGDDELGRTASAFDQAIQHLAAHMAELARDRGRMAALLADMVEGVMVIDAQGRLQLANDAARRMLKLDDMAVGRHYIETIRHPSLADLVGAALSGERPSVVELSPPRDAARTITARAAPAMVGGGAQGVVMVLHDITDLRHADQMRRDFVANVSHELRTPLTAIMGYVEALAEADIGVADRQRFLETIRRHTLRMEGLVRDLLRLARLDAGQEMADLAQSDLRSLIQFVAAELAPALESRGQRTELDVDPTAERVIADPAKLQDALRNLMVNASTYAPAGTTIRVRAWRAGGTVSIAIADEGPGIPEEDLSRIFERFYRVDKSRARDPGGTGLGLAITKHLIELHGGRVRAANAPAGGAVFTIELPVQTV